MAIGAACFVGGFFYPLLFIPAAIIGMTLRATPEEQHEAGRPKPKAPPIGRVNIKAEEPDWKSRYLEACESPAESSFLTAMIASFSLQPARGVLQAPGLTLEMQVEMGPYRLDFLANGWLVIEIDGAAWHSSPEAVSRDRIRDRYFESYDYTVLRIPAKTVFSMPHEAVRMVRAALGKGRKAPAQKETAAQKPHSILGAVGGFVRDVGEFAEGVSAYVDRASAIQEAMSKPRAIFDAEKHAIQIAMEAADREIKVEQFRSQSARHREIYDQSVRDMEALFSDKLGGRDSGAELRRLMRERITPIQEPQPHPKEEINEAIRTVYASLMEERAAYFREVRQKLTPDEARYMLVKGKLLDMGCASCWAAVAPMASKAVFSLSDFLATASYANQTQVPDSSSTEKTSSSSARPSSLSSGKFSSEM
ncbi:endonuclease domain-containing protein [Roseomonas gilardii]|uniref:endonuclease domain-containing protein n=1 Tax=Roseomonas gilardii TaxID=257708 RepID=UPI0016437647|nr:DUF559 domain-containing protein [Roseomonas gilardii]